MPASGFAVLWCLWLSCQGVLFLSALFLSSLRVFWAIRSKVFCGLSAIVGLVCDRGIICWLFWGWIDVRRGLMTCVSFIIRFSFWWNGPFVFSELCRLKLFLAFNWLTIISALFFVWSILSPASSVPIIRPVLVISALQLLLVCRLWFYDQILLSNSAYTFARAFANYLPKPSTSAPDSNYIRKETVFTSSSRRPKPSKSSNTIPLKFVELIWYCG